MAEHGTPAVRQLLIDAALACLATQEYHSVSVRAITGAAGVTPGLLRYYFAGKRELMLEAYRQFQRDWLAAHLRAAAGAGPEPASRLEAFTRSVLLSNAADRKQAKIRVNFQALVITDAQIAAAHAESYDRFLQVLEGWIGELYAGRSENLTTAAVRKLAISVNSIIEGVLLPCILYPSAMTSEEAVEIALYMIGANLGVSFDECG